MVLRKALPLILFAVFFSITVPRYSASATPADSRGALTELAEKVRFYTLPNGLRVVLYHRGIAPVFAGVVAVRVGGTDEELGETGISHMLEHMAFKGTAAIGTKDWPREQKLLEELETIMKRAVAGSITDEENARKAAITKELTALWKNEQFTREFEVRGATGMNASTDKELTRYHENLPRASCEYR
jgi:predicted Zn-dependent peptidase